MTTTITTPKNVVPVGQVTIGGTTYDVKQHPEFVRFFFDLFRRVGGNTGMTNTDLEDAIDELTLELAITPPVAADVTQRYADMLMAPPYEPLPLPAENPSGRLEALEATVAAMARQISDLQIGYQL